MDQHSDNWWNRSREKIALFFGQVGEWAAMNKKISIPVAVVVVVALLAGVAVFLSGKGKDKEAGQDSADGSVSSVPEVPLEEDAVAAVNELMNKYYAALADGDVETLEQIIDYVSDSDKLRIEKKSNYIEKYEGIVCYTKTGLVDDSYIVYAYNKVKLYDFETLVPSLSTFVVFKNEAGEYYIYEGDLDENTLNYYTELTKQDDVTNLCNKVQAEYNEAVRSDSELEAFMDGFPALIKDEVAEALAQMEQGGVESAEAAGEEEEQPEESEEEEAQESKAKVTEVETTDTVNVRSSDSEMADKVGKAEKGTRLPLIEKKGNGWSKIEFEGKEAYIKSEYLADVVNVVDEDGGETDTGADASVQQAETEGTSSQQESSTGLVGKDGKVTAKTTVNVRASASENGERLGVIYQGDALELVMQQADGWCKVKYNGQTGYVKTEFVE